MRCLIFSYIGNRDVNFLEGDLIASATVRETHFSKKFRIYFLPYLSEGMFECQAHRAD